MNTNKGVTMNDERMYCPECGCEMDLITDYDPAFWYCPKCKTEIDYVIDSDDNDDDNEDSWSDFGGV
jgi:transcription initiation factor TFIIIB Brf1 subunit/transcription initiation factor TFIIB